MKEKYQPINKDGTDTGNLFDLVKDEAENVKVVNRLRYKHEIVPIPTDYEEVKKAKLLIRERLENAILVAVLVKQFPLDVRFEIVMSCHFTVRLRPGWTQATCVFQSPVVVSALLEKFPKEFSYEILKVPSESINDFYIWNLSLKTSNGARKCSRT